MVAQWQRNVVPYCVSTVKRHPALMRLLKWRRQKRGWWKEELSCIKRGYPQVTWVGILEKRKQWLPNFFVLKVQVTYVISRQNDLLFHSGLSSLYVMVNQVDSDNSAFCGNVSSTVVCCAQWGVAWWHSVIPSTWHLGTTQALLDCLCWPLCSDTVFGPRHMLSRCFQIYPSCCIFLDNGVIFLRRLLRSPEEHKG